MMFEEVQIGDCRLILGDCLKIMPTLPMVDAVITDPPYSKRCHDGHNASVGNGRTPRTPLSYSHLTEQDVKDLAAEYALICKGWIVWMTDFHLAMNVRIAMDAVGRYVFSPLPFHYVGRSVRLFGDGPCSWTDWIVVARTSAQMRWGTLPGGYVSGPGWNDKERIGGKPTALMDRLVSDYSRIGDTVLDTHMGAGTTGVSCARLGRKFIGCEIDKESFDLSCRRIENAYSQGSLLDLQQQAPTTDKSRQDGLF